MNPLSNAGLLDGDVSKNMNPIKNNRSERLQRTTRFAENPEQVEEEASVAEVEQTHNYSDSPSSEPEEEKSYKQMEKYLAPYPEAAKAEKAEAKNDDKIFGMNKMLVIGIGAAALIIGGYFVYKKFIKKSDVVSGVAGAASSVTPAVAAAPAAPVIK